MRTVIPVVTNRTKVIVRGMGLSPSSGRLVRPRHLLPVLFLGTAVLFLGVPVTLLRQLSDGSAEPSPPLFAAVAATLLLFVVFPLWGGIALLRRRVYVSDEQVTVTAGDTVKRELRFDRLSEVRPVIDGSQGAATPEFYAKAVVLYGLDARDKKVALKLTAQTLDMDPVFAALAPVVQRRPELITTDLGRTLFAEYAASRNSVEG